MIIKKPIFWDKKRPDLLSTILLPFTIPLIINNILINFLSKEKSKEIKTICIGNIYLGGTGKTPFTIKLYKILKKLGHNVVVGKKYYKNQYDEQTILKHETTLITEKNRKKIIDKAIKNKKEILIFDDGLQERKIQYDLKIVCFDNQNWIGNGHLIPSGPLRESITSLKKYDAVVLKQSEDSEENKEITHEINKINPNIKIFYTYYTPLNLDMFDLSKKYIVFSGIGNPLNFRELLKKNNFNIVEEKIYPDHFNYNQKNIDDILKRAENIDAEIVTTEKDFMKIAHLNHGKINFLKVDMEIKNINGMTNFLKEKING